MKELVVCNIVIDVPIPEKGMEGIEDLDAYELGIWKGNGRVTIVVGVGGMEGGGSLGISSRLVESDAITQNMWVCEKREKKIKHGGRQMISLESQFLTLSTNKTKQKVTGGLVSHFTSNA